MKRAEKIPDEVQSLMDASYAIMQQCRMSKEQWCTILFEVGCEFVESWIDDARHQRELLIDKSAGYWDWWMLVYMADDRQLLGDSVTDIKRYRHTKMYLLQISEMYEQLRIFLNRNINRKYMLKYKLKGTRKHMETIRDLCNYVIASEHDAEPLHKAVITELYRRLQVKLVDFQPHYSFSISIAQAISIRVLFAEYIQEYYSETDYMYNYLRQISDDIHKMISDVTATQIQH